MSILNGTVSADVIFHEKPPFGECLREVGTIPTVGSWDCTVLPVSQIESDSSVRMGLGEDETELLVAAVRGKVEIYRVGNEKNPTAVLVSALDGIGDSRQISVSDGFAYVTTRPDGVFVCDLRYPEKPILAAKIDSIELATGVNAADGVLAVTNRHMGCELYDVRNPYQPKFLGDFLCGEAQSVWLYKTLALVGDWMNKQVRIFDIRRMPAVEVSRVAIDGFADGVCAFSRDGHDYCLVASGHHAALLKNRRKYLDYPFIRSEMSAEGFGGGHGVTLIDITEPSLPEFVSEIKAPPLFGGPDTWRVFTDGNLAYYTDSMSGVFVISLDNLLKLSFVGYYKLPPKPSTWGRGPAIQVTSDSITGASIVNGILCAASNGDGVHLLLPQKEGSFGKPIAAVMDAVPTVVDKSYPTVIKAESMKNPLCEKQMNLTRIYQNGGQIHSCTALSGIWCASGNAELICLPDNNVLAAKETSFFVGKNVQDVMSYRGYLLTAEGQDGFACYRVGKGTGGVTLTECSRIAYGVGHCAKELIDCGEYICVQLGSGSGAVMKMDENGSLQKCGEAQGIGLLYHRHIARTSAAGYILSQAINPGPALWKFGENGLKGGGSLHIESCPFADGVCGYRDKIILIRHGRYGCLGDVTKLDGTKESDLMTVAGVKFDGQPFVCGDKLAILNRYTGRIEILDIHEPKNPVLLGRIESGLYPEFAAMLDGNIYIACGHAGLYRLNID